MNLKSQPLRMLSNADYNEFIVGEKRHFAGLTGQTHENFHSVTFLKFARLDSKRNESLEALRKTG